MSQITTYSRGKKGEAQKIADTERKKEKRQKEDAERRASLAASADADIQKVAADIVLEKEKNIAPPDMSKVQAHEAEKKAQREADMERLAELVTEQEKDKAMFYRFIKSAFTAALRDTKRSVEAGRIAVRLGVSNPITSGVMGIGSTTGVLQDKVKFFEAICKRLAIRYRAIGSISAEDFESPVGT